MNIKKILMIVILIVFVIAIVGILVNINNKPVEKQNDISTNDNNIAQTSGQIAQGSNKIRKSTEKAKVNKNNMIEITDNFFIEQTNDIYLNLEDYIGKTIKIEGFTYSYKDLNGDTCYAVVRNTPGCCGGDGLAGLDIRYDEDYPEKGAWVEVIGVIGTDTMYGNKIPAIQVASITIKEEGKAFVTN